MEEDFEPKNVVLRQGQMRKLVSETLFLTGPIHSCSFSFDKLLGLGMGVATRVNRMLLYDPMTV